MAALVAKPPCVIFYLGGLMKLDDFKPTSQERFHNDPAAVDAAQKELATHMPSEYREFITRFGEGTLGGYVRVYPPHQILKGDNCVTEWRKRIDEYWFWDDGADVLPKVRALECLIVADTVDGDELAFHPSEPDRLYVLPRYDEMVYVAGDGLLAAIEWLLTSGTLTKKIKNRKFEPFDGKAAGNG
jgi:hypothetical protein